MDFYISIALSDQFKVDQNVFNRYQQGEFGGDIGITLDSKIADYSDSQLAIVTEMACIGQSDKVENIAQCRFLTKFHFENTAVLTSGVNTKAIHCIQECINLAQAHAYGLFCYHSRKNNVPIVATQIQPFEHLQKAVNAFLNYVKK